MQKSIVCTKRELYALFGNAVTKSKLVFCLSCTKSKEATSHKTARRSLYSVAQEGSVTEAMNLPSFASVKNNPSYFFTTISTFVSPIPICPRLVERNFCSLQ